MNERKTTLIYDDLLSEGFHAAFRKASDHPISGQIWRLIQDLPQEEWAAVIDFVLYGAKVKDQTDA